MTGVPISTMSINASTSLTTSIACGMFTKSNASCNFMCHSPRCRFLVLTQCMSHKHSCEVRTLNSHTDKKYTVSVYCNSFQLNLMDLDVFPTIRYFPCLIYPKLNAL